MCLKKSALLLEEAAILATAGDEHVRHSSVLFSYAVEELGKAAILREELERNSEKPTIRGFYHHPTKIGKATELVGEEQLELRRGAFQRTGFQATGFDVGVQTDLDTRLRALYVDWDPERFVWRTEMSVDKDLLLRNIERLKEVVREKMETWWRG